MPTSCSPGPVDQLGYMAKGIYTNDGIQVAHLVLTQQILQNFLEPNVIIMVLNNEKREAEEGARIMCQEMLGTQPVMAGSEDGKKKGANEYVWTPEAGKRQGNKCPLGASRKGQSPADSWISD